MMRELHYETYSAEETPVEVATLVYETLYRDWNVPLEPIEQWYNARHGGRFLLVQEKDNGKLLGALRLMPANPEDPGRMQIRQVVIRDTCRGRGLGTLLMDKAAEIAVTEGVTELWLDAREPAWRFYEKLGYEYISDIWMSRLTVIPHRTMSKMIP